VLPRWYNFESFFVCAIEVQSWQVTTVSRELWKFWAIGKHRKQNAEGFIVKVQRPNLSGEKDSLTISKHKMPTPLVIFTRVEGGGMFGNSPLQVVVVLFIKKSAGMQTYSFLHVLFLMNKTKDHIPWVSSHDLYWENKMYKRKRSISAIKEL